MKSLQGEVLYSHLKLVSALKMHRQITSQMEHVPMSEQKSFSFLKGYSFSFDDNGRKIEVWFSALSGFGKVFVDGNLVSPKGNISFQSSNNFNIGEDSYSTSIKAVSLSRGPFVCTLSKNGKEFKRQKLVFPPLKNDLGKRSYWFQLLFYLVVAFVAVVVTLAAAYWLFPQVSVIIYLMFIAMVSLSYVAYFMRKEASKTEIIDEEII